MPFIGNSVQTQGFTPAIDYFNGNGSTVTFTLSRPVVSVAQMVVVVANVIQNPASAYTVSGNAITFTSAPPSGTNNIWVEYTSLITTYAAISQSPSVIGDITASGGYLAVGSFGNSFIDGTIVDYVTGNGRITVGPADGLTLYTGGTSARSALATWDQNGNLGLGTTTPDSKLVVYGTDKRVRITDGTNSLDLGQWDGVTNRVESSGRSLQFIQYGASNNITFATNATERMRIDSSGRTTIPYQPAFSAFRTTPNNFGGTYGTLGSLSTYFNTGNNLNTTSGIFTAPVTGNYFFSFVIRGNDGSSASSGVTARVMKNSTMYVFDIWGGPAATNDGTYRNFVSGSVVMNMAAGDTASFQILGFFLQGNFSGYLLG